MFCSKSVLSYLYFIVHVTVYLLNVTQNQISLITEPKPSIKSDVFIWMPKVIGFKLATLHCNYATQSA